MHEENKIIADEPIELDPSELLGLSQVAKVSGVPGKPVLGRVLNKIGPEGPHPGRSNAPVSAFQVAQQDRRNGNAATSRYTFSRPVAQQNRRRKHLADYSSGWRWGSVR